ncbi:hypothetical protein FQZ97_1186270 [compost metagenome]
MHLREQRPVPRNNGSDHTHRRLHDQCRYVAVQRVMGILSAYVPRLRREIKDGLDNAVLSGAEPLLQRSAHIKRLQKR